MWIYMWIPFFFPPTDSPLFVSHQQEKGKPIISTKESCFGKEFFINFRCSLYMSLYKLESFPFLYIYIYSSHNFFNLNFSEPITLSELSLKNPQTSPYLQGDFL